MCVASLWRAGGRTGELRARVRTRSGAALRRMLVLAPLLAPAHASRVVVDRDGSIHYNDTVYSSWDQLREEQHTATHKCGSHRSREEEEEEEDQPRTRRRKLEQSDCTATFNNPADQYAPTASVPILTIRTVVHIVTNGPTTGYISPACVSSGIARLNDDFRGASRRGGASVDTRIDFALATHGPDGSETTGMVYHDNGAWFNQQANPTPTLSLEGGTLTVVDDTTSGLWSSLWDPARYMNIYLKNTGDGTAGSATLASSSAVNPATDGIIINYDVWGDCATSADFNLGVTATHEVGHYLGLLHTFDNVHSVCAAETAPDCHQKGGERVGSNGYNGCNRDRTGLPPEGR